MVKTIITKNTEQLLNLRRDDYRIGLIYDIMFSDDIGGSHPDRKFTVVNLSGQKETYTLRKATEYDGLSYEKVASVDTMKSTIESNILNLQKIKKSGPMAGMMPIKDIWVIVFTTDKNGEDIQLNTYFNPDANDCSDIVKTDRLIVLSGFIITYSTKTSKDDKLPEGTPEEIYEFAFFSPLDMANLEEYNKISLEQEAKTLQDAFLIKFDISKL